MSKLFFTYQQAGKEVPTIVRLDTDNLEEAKRQADEIWKELLQDRKIQLCSMASGAKYGICDNQGEMQCRKVAESWHNNDYLKSVDATVTLKIDMIASLGQTIDDLNRQYDEALIRLEGVKDIPPRPQSLQEPALPANLGSGYGIFTSKENKAAFKAHKEWQEKNAVIEQQQKDWDARYAPQLAHQKQAERLEKEIQAVEIRKQEFTKDIAHMKGLISKLKVEMKQYSRADKEAAERVLTIAERYVEQGEKALKNKGAEIDR